ncbi:MAG: ATP-binding cassette domain-containing protein [Lentimicrobiaceae bacterium]|jgi:phospholipid/cholesterol/gamma-HCH transport system ATP-binding protein|nr:ATP-binding cassette domain-containing protein [Lentimicrobiaceae bacterium]MCP4909111.1 ATP-binding cassette domain-containing protein [Bacteroidota bacterium]MBT3454351.1 ATP-binding cassette domain-containing protein [Lentimicrobiaceae bacterium]MBT3817925.1 ATP-binding cassette domain-containing protein [Lentimicrobiaceae bacterium]MBT4061569.1 ATP-binding cassette domain-containing protein [Lentimicrobiaceae bacterium]
MIKVDNISKSFADQTVLKDISTSFEKGKTNLIIGQSGSGKTVLMKCCIGLFDVDKGSIFFDDRNFSGLSEKDKKETRQEMGVLFQGGALFDSFTVEENIMFPLNMFTKQSYEEKLERVNAVLSHVNLTNANSKYPAELSGGMIKRVAIARAIAMNPKYLFCDEPNSGLDPKTAEVIDELISELTHKFNMTTVINTHDMNSVLQIGQKIAFINKGELWWEGDNKEILKADNKELNDFVFSTELTRRIK